MPSPRFQVVPSAYLFLLREGARGLEVLLQLRRGTGYMDGWWSAGAAGHVEAGESVLQAMQREAREELGLDLPLEALEPRTTLHRRIAVSGPIEERYCTFFTTRDWSGEPTLQEADKAADLRWFPLDALPDRVVPHERQVLDAVAESERTGEPVPPVLTRGFEQSLTLVVAVAENRAIGRDGDLPWHLPGDLKHFKDTTDGGVMVMGRRTFESIGRPLPGRTSIVMTGDRDWLPGGQIDPCDRDAGPRFPEVLVARSWAEALLMAGDTEVFVLGGAGVFAEALPHATRLVLTEVHQSPAGCDTFFPELDAGWAEAERTPAEDYDIVEYRRR